jgi:hypothetical protein
MREPDWTIDEFEILITHNDVASAQLSRLLPRRTLGAMEAVRNGIHLFHTTGDGSMLSEMMRQQLLQVPDPLLCPTCKAKLKDM